jgi:undecaprenyl phosphate N,N'-diacetylbacillosamine 1-phosphate transferase
MYKSLLKPIFDFLVSFMLFMVISPVFLLVTILLFITNHGKPFFLQTRPGKGNKVFRVIKFRTMIDRKDSKGNLLPDDERLSPLGTFIRETSLDEIPQLLNVIKGEMSLVGPRPLLPEYLSLYSKEQARRHNVKPGITGWAQVNGRNAISWEKKFILDVWYIDNMSLALDIKILYMTMKNTLRKKGISKNGYITTDKYDGYN